MSNDSNSNSLIVNCSICGKSYPHISEFFFWRDRKRGILRKECKSCNNAGTKKRYHKDIDKSRKNANQRQSTFRKNHHELVLERTRDWRKRNQECVSRYNKWYRETNPQKDSESKEKRAERLTSLPKNFGIEDWQFALEYFDYKCVVCGRSDENGLVITPDHWIALADPREDNPGTVPNNIIPLCFGIGGCQGSKHALDPNLWVKRRLGEEVGSKVLKKIQEYFQQVRK